MRIMRWGVAASAALITSVPFAAEAATVSKPSTGTTSSAQTPAPTAPTAPSAPSAPAAPSAPTAPSSAPVSSAPSAPAPSGVPTGSAPAHPSTTASPARSATQSTTQSSTSTPAPPGTAEGYAARVDGILALSHTKASASGTGESSTADPLELGGTPLGSVFGGTQTGPGSSSGAFFDTGTQSFGRIAITPWTATNTSTSSGNTASAISDILIVDLGSPGTAQSITLNVLQSKSDANWTSSGTTSSSTSTGSTDGAILDVGGPSGLVVDVLHSQTSSSGAGSSYLLSINGNQIGTSSQAGGKCVITVPPVLTLDCLTATGGVGTTGAGGTVLTSGAGVASATLGSGPGGLKIGLLETASSLGHGPASLSAGNGSGSGAGTGAGAGGPAVAGPAHAVSSGHSRLAFTGAETVPTVAGAAALVGGGLGLVAASRRRRRRAQPAV